MAGGRPGAPAMDHQLRGLEAHEVLGLDVAGDAAEVDRPRRSGDDLGVVDARVRGDDRRQVGGVEAGVEIDRGEAELGQLGDVGVVVGDLRSRARSRRMIFSAGDSRVSPTPPCS